MFVHAANVWSADGVGIPIVETAAAVVATTGAAKKRKKAKKAQRKRDKKEGEGTQPKELPLELEALALGDEEQDRLEEMD